ncbi:hypothetical protein [Kangiella sp.]|uniref:hypothetical protein n=1 Tax=Kangiella sp. TaxID=1920245 RepID=UPI003A92CF44
MSKKTSIEHQFIAKWQSAEELSVPASVDQCIEKSVLDAFDKRKVGIKREKTRSNYGWYYAVAASLLVAVVSWQLLFHEKLSGDYVSQPNTMLVSAIKQSQQLEATFEQLKHQPLSEFIYVQKFQLEKELLSINSKLADAYGNEDDSQDKLQLWHQKNKTLSQLNALIVNAKSVHATHI